MRPRAGGKLGDEDLRVEGAFSAAYLRIQEEKLQKQQYEIHRLTDRLREDNETDRMLVANLSHNTLRYKD